MSLSIFDGGPLQMSFRRRISVHRLGLVPVTALVLVSAVGARAQAATTSRIRTAAATAAPTNAAAISGDLLKATGHSAAQLSTRAACATPTAGHFSCYARVLTVKSTGKPATLLHAPHAGSASDSPATSGATAPQEYTAAYLQSAYDTTWLSANEGSSDTVAIVDAYADGDAYSDMQHFRSDNGLASISTCATSTSTSCFEVVSQSGSTTHLPTTHDETGSWNVEESLDIDAVSSICPLCKIVVVEANSDSDANLEAAVQEASAAGANQISLSWGADVSPDYTAYSYPYSTLTGATILAASGDDTYPGPDVGYPAALPDVTAVGGTSLASSSTTTRGFAESAWSVETCGDDTPCATESGCDTSQAVPQWQNSATTGCDGRAYNDISADGDPETGLEIYDSQSGSEGCETGDECIVGGTSLATPLTAALEAVTDVPGTSSPSWTYSDASLLNDIVSGSDGTCPSGWYLICNAASGWDGPTGNGSISGDLASGGPGLGGISDSGVNATDVTLNAGLYPNSESTSYDLQYWVDGLSSTTTASATSGTIDTSTLQDVSATLCNALSPETTYDYDLTASNASGSETGYTGSFTTAATESSPSVSVAPAISGSAEDGQTLTGSDASWNDQSCDSQPSYAWQESSSSGGPWTTIGSGQSYQLSSANDGYYIRFTATESNSGNSALTTTASSSVIGPATEPGAQTSSAPVTTTTTVSTTTTTTSGTTASAGEGSTSTTTTTTKLSGGGTKTTRTVRFYRCSRSCTLIDTHGAKSYTPGKADYGRYIKVVTTVSRIDGNTETDTTTTRWDGPVGAPTAGSISIGSGARVASAALIKGSAGKHLAEARVTQNASGKRLTLVVRRETSAATQVWAYVVSGRQVVSGTAAHTLSRPATLSFTLKRGQTVRLVAVST